MKKKFTIAAGWGGIILLIIGILYYVNVNIKPVPQNDVRVNRERLTFSSEKSFKLAAEFATRFTNRHSGTNKNRESALWIQQKFLELGYAVEIDEFEATLYGKPTRLQNVIAVKHGRSAKAIAVLAHLDQARTTVQGADNDASGIGIMLHLAEIFQNADTQYSLVFIATDGEEYGMLGARHFVETHPLQSHVTTAVSLDNVGRYNSESMHMAAIGQKKGYTPLWLATLVQDVASKIGVWRPTFPDTAMQLVERSILISFTDQGPFLAHGISAFDLGVTSPGGWPYYHTPEDTIDRISPVPMEQVGLLTEALVIELDRYDEIPLLQESFLYFDNEKRSFMPSKSVKAATLALLFPLFWLTILTWNGAWQGFKTFIIQIFNIFLNTLPMLGGLLCLYLSTSINLIPSFSYYPAPPKDPALFEVKWMSIFLFLATIGLLSLFVILIKKKIPLEGKLKKPVTLTILSVLAVLIFLKNSFSLLFLLPALYFWPLIIHRKSFLGKALNMFFFLMGGVFIFLILFAYSSQIFVGWFILWYFLQMLAFKMIAPCAAVAGIIAIASGIALLEQ